MEQLNKTFNRYKLIAVVLLGLAPTSCVVSSVVGTAADVAGTVVSTAVDVTAGVVTGAVDIATGGESDENQEQQNNQAE